MGIAKKHHAVLHILHVDENNFQSIDDITSAYTSNSTNNIDVINALIGAIQHRHGIEPVVVMEEGDVADTIIKVSLLNHTDLIVMRSHGASGYRDSFIGNNTYHVIKHAPCPVLAVPQRKKLNVLRKILFPIRPVTGALMPYEIVSHFTSPNAVVDVLGITYRMIMETAGSVLDTIVGEIKDQLKKDQVTAKSLWIEGQSSADEIVRYTNKSNPDLDVVTSALDGTRKARYIGPHAQKIIHCYKVPVLSIKKLSVPSLV